MLMRRFSLKPSIMDSQGREMPPPDMPPGGPDDAPPIRAAIAIGITIESNTDPRNTTEERVDQTDAASARRRQRRA